MKGGAGKIKTGLFIGRFQPFHEGHRRCIEQILAANDVCVVLIRDTRVDNRNRSLASERWQAIRDAFPDVNRVTIRMVPDLDEDLTVYIGRDTGYKLVELDVEAAVADVAGAPV